MQKTNVGIDMLFEVSWEVCNKVGGIYTLLSTKAKELHKNFGDKLVFIGPDIWTEENVSPCFIERKTLLKNAASKVKLPFGISIRIGRWDIPGSPLVVLVGYKGMFEELNRIYGDMWNVYGVDSLHAYGDYDESCAFAVASAIVADALVSHLKVKSNGVVAHFDEWTTGMGLLYLKHINPGIATVFTTHATSIGRSICGNGKPLYDYFTGYDGDQMARELNMVSKHSLEKAAAFQADCFTTVSEVTARECRQLLGIAPQVITPNGFEPDFVPSSSKYVRQRNAGRTRLLKLASFLSGHPWPEDTFIVATSGRNEYRNKGIDLYLDSVDRLRNRDLGRNVLSLVLVPAWVKEPSGALIADLTDGGDVRPQPDWLTHRLNNEESDAIACRIRRMQEESGSDKTKVVFVPCYLDGNDGIVNLSYYDLLPALDMTIFPSYYEPWGYTPLESIAFGVPTVSSDKAGFGQWVQSTFGDSAQTGVEVVSRSDSNYGSCADRIADMIESYSGIPENEYKALRAAAVRTSKAADWTFFIEKYYEAYSYALAKSRERMYCK